MAAIARWKLWVLLCMAIVVLLVAVPALGGRLLSQRHVASSRIELNESPGTVWQTINDFASDPTWRHEVESEERLADRDGHAVWKEHYRSGSAVVYETVESCPPRRLVRKIVDQSAFSGIWKFDLLPHDGGTELRLTETSEIYNPVFRFVSRYVMGHYRTMDNYEKALAVRLGDTPRVEHLAKASYDAVSSEAAQPCSSAIATKTP